MRKNSPYPRCGFDYYSDHKTPVEGGQRVLNDGRGGRRELRGDEVRREDEAESSIGEHGGRGVPRLPYVLLGLSWCRHPVSLATRTGNDKGSKGNRFDGSTIQFAVLYLYYTHTPTRHSIINTTHSRATVYHASSHSHSVPARLLHRGHARALVLLLLGTPQFTCTVLVTSRVSSRHH